MPETPHTPEEIEQAGRIAVQLLQGRELWPRLRINPSEGSLRRSAGGFLALVRQIDPRQYGRPEFSAVIAILDDAANSFRAFYYLNRPFGDFEFLLSGANEIAQIRRSIVQGLAPDPLLNPSAEQRRQQTVDSERDLYQALMGR